jgi:phenylalanyl-tRNA synthetase alpha chain
VQTLTGEQLIAALAVRDLTDPAHGEHAIQTLLHDAIAAVARALRCAVHIERGTRVVAVRDNYDALGIGADAVARDSKHTRYVDGATMLRSHTSALVPPALRTLAVASHREPRVLVACPGVVHRRDVIDRLHTPTPHMLDLWPVVTVDAPLGVDDLHEMIDTVVRAVLPGARYRTEPRTHPYTTRGLRSTCAAVVAGSRSASAVSPPRTSCAPPGSRRRPVWRWASVSTAC